MITRNEMICRNRRIDWEIHIFFRHLGTLLFQHMEMFILKVGTFLNVYSLICTREHFVFWVFLNFNESLCD